MSFNCTMNSYSQTLLMSFNWAINIKITDVI